MSILAHIGNTLFNMYQQSFNKQWDKKLKALIDEHGETAATRKYTLVLGKFEVWTSNKWYCYGHAYRFNDEPLDKSLWFRPSYFTMRKLDKLVKKIEKQKRLKREAETKAKIDELFQ